MENTKERGNPVEPKIEKAPAPSQVVASQLMPPPEPIEKGTVSSAPPIQQAEPSKEVIKKELETEPKGTIVIKIYEDHPYEIDFNGKITGSEVDIAWRAIMKQYRVWKHKLFRDKEFGGV